MKLVRDLRPELSEREYISSSQISANLYATLLVAKLREECEEVAESLNLADNAVPYVDPDELADVLEVVECLADLSGASFMDVVNRKIYKADHKGSFRHRRVITLGDDPRGHI